MSIFANKILREYICRNIYTERLVVRIYKKLFQLNKQNINYQIKYWQQIWTDISSKKMANKYMKRFPKPLTIKEIQFKTKWCIIIWASLIAQLVKNPPAMKETTVWFLGWEDPLEKEKATYSSILAWRIPWTWLSDFHFHFSLHRHISTRMTKFKRVTISTELKRL